VSDTPPIRMYSHRRICAKSVDNPPEETNLHVYSARPHTTPAHAVQTKKRADRCFPKSRFLDFIAEIGLIPGRVAEGSGFRVQVRWENIGKKAKLGRIVARDKYMERKIGG
jgi:hypothetical protein